MSGRRGRLLTAALCLLAAPVCVAQEPTYMEAATHPGAGQFYLRLLASRSVYRQDGAAADLHAAAIRVAYGLRPTLAALLESELAALDTDRDDETGLRLTTLRLKYRLFKADLGPLNTWRTSLTGGVAIPGDVDDGTLPSEPSPRCGVVSTAILGRHGLNAGVEWQAGGEAADRVALNGSYLFRLAPDVYTAETRGAWYTMTESLNAVAEGGEADADVAVGLLYEARRWACEVSLRLPLDRHGARERDYTITAGLRLLP